jgi:hypothetical protein
MNHLHTESSFSSQGQSSLIKVVFMSLAGATKGQFRAQPLLPSIRQSALSSAARLTCQKRS